MAEKMEWQRKWNDRENGVAQKNGMYTQSRHAIQIKIFNQLKNAKYTNSCYCLLNYIFSPLTAA